jgi:nitroreductase
MNFADLLTRNRSYRRFHEDQPVDRRTLVDLVELTRRCPSAANRQPLKYLVVASPEENHKLFRHLRWAVALRDWNGPAEGERPTGYIVILGDTEITMQFTVDPGIAAQSMLLAAVERGMGGCMVGSIDREGLRADFHIPERFAIALVVALGVPNETVVLETATSPENVDYWRDADGVHHVPKRPLEELLVRFV